MGTTDQRQAFEVTKHLCQCGAEWISPAHTRCKGCAEPRSGYSVSYHQGYVDATAVADKRIAELEKQQTALVNYSAVPDLLAAAEWAFRELCEAWDEDYEKAIPVEFRTALRKLGDTP